MACDFCGLVLTTQVGVQTVGSNHCRLSHFHLLAIFALSRRPVALCSINQSVLRNFHVCREPLPKLQGGLLDGASVGKSEWPRYPGAILSVHRIEVSRR